MTGFSIPGGFLLSPLHDDILEMREKTVPLIKNSKTHLDKNNAESLVGSSDLFNPGQDIKGRTTQRIKADQKRGQSSDLKIPSFDDRSIVLNKDIKLEVPFPDERLNVTPPSRYTRPEQNWTGESAKVSGRTSNYHLNGMKNKQVKDKICNSEDKLKVESMTDSEARSWGTDEIHPKGKLHAKTSKPEKGLEEHSLSNNKEPVVDWQTERKPKDEVIYDKIKADSDGLKGTMDGPVDIKDNAGLQPSVDVKGKKKSSSSRANQSGKKSKVKSHKEPSSAINRKSYGDDVDDVFEKRSGFSDLRHKDTKRSAKLENEPSGLMEPSIDRPSSRHTDNCQIPNASVDGSIHMPPASNPAATDTAAPVLIKEEWVGCDKCEKWRLLPYWVNPSHLPKKWRCSMLDWLPLGMNSCKISEDETTKAVHALFIQAPEMNNNLSGRHDVAASGMPSAAAIQNVGPTMQPMNAAGKRRNGPKSGANLPNSLKLPDASKSLKNHTFDVDHHPAAQSTLEKDFMEPGYKSSDLTEEKQKSRQKEKRKSLGSYSEKGEYMMKSSKQIKSKSSILADPGDIRAMKKIRKETLNSPANHLPSEFKLGQNGFSTKSQRYNDASLVKDKYDPKVSLSLSSKRLHSEDQIFSNTSTSDVERSGQLDFSVKKRKVKQWQLIQCNSGADASMQHMLNNEMVAREALSESESMKEKKPTATRSELKVPKDHDLHQLERYPVKDKNVAPTHDEVDDDVMAYTGNGHLNMQSQANIRSQHSVVCEGPLKRGVSLAEDSTAATSSSSKVSSSRKSKTDFQEVRGSPVESVSSSPLKSGDRNLIDQSRMHVHGGEDNTHSQDSDNLNNDQRPDTLNNRMSEKNASSLSKESRSYQSDVERAKVNVYGDFNGNANPCGLRSGEGSRDEDSGNHFDIHKKELELSAKRDLGGKLSDLGENQHVLGEKCSVSKPNILLSHRDEKSSTRSLSDQNEHSKLQSGKDKLALTSDKERTQNQAHHLPSSPVNGSKQQSSLGIGVNVDASKVPRQSKGGTIPNGSQHNHLRQATVNGDTSSTVNASVVLKEARDLKHMANRLKNEGQDLESTSLYFEAALKFLHVASLWEPPSFDSLKQGDATQSMQMYSDTAKLCDFCAHEFERLKKMAAAALAYKCVEVAHFKAAFYKYPNAAKDRGELQAVLQMVPPGESPSSSASDVDNLNNQSTLAKAVSAKGVNSPQVASSHGLAVRNHPHLMRMLTYTHDLNCAFDATRKSQTAFTASLANVENDKAEGIASVRKVLDFNFHNVKGLLQLVRLSMESIGR